jgi:hypothetical protein
VSATWATAIVEGLCGGCGRSIPVGDRFVFVTLTGLKTPKRRCAVCAQVQDYHVTEPRVESQAPVTLPSLPRLTLTAPVERAFYDREPGEDDA